ncbi:DUF2061 domain-containing protein [Patescibacteria group bacterium]|nr:DUF2061 domain-containing protein [Patescibacteria group bacterium]
MKANHRRSIIKSISWRFLATLTTMIIVFIFTGEILLSFGVGFFEVILKLILYYIHERLWNRTSWGRLRV